MIKSMTGYGQAVLTSGKASITVEIKSLNSKFLDLSLRLPRIFSDRELELRNFIADKLERGKVSFAIDYQTQGGAALSQTYNAELFKSYYAELKKLADHAGIAPPDTMFSIALNSPDVIVGGAKEEIDPAEWSKVQQLIGEAVEKFEKFRSDEGSVLADKIKSYIGAIRVGLTEVETLDPKRIERVRNKIKGNIAEFFGAEGFDANRLEQEIIFYIEKLDIHEERVRLKAHLDYFMEVMDSVQSNGKKLAFIAQEIGREINTIGSKSNDAGMQKQVVTMKEELEKIKEQLNNII